MIGRVLCGAVVAGFLWMGVSQAQETGKEAAPADSNKVRIDWKVRPVLGSLNVDGSGDLYRTHYRRSKGGLRLAELSFLVLGLSRNVEEVRLEISGLDENSMDAIEVTLRKFRSYKLDLYRYQRDTFFGDPGVAFGQHGWINQTKTAGANLTITPIHRLRLNLRYDTKASEGEFGTTVHSSWDEFPLSSKRNWSSERYSGGMNLSLGPVNLEVDHSSRKFDLSENVRLRNGEEEGNNPEDQALLLSFGANRPRNSEAAHTNAVIRWSGGSLQMSARYERVRNQTDSKASQTQEDTNPAGGKQKITSDYTASVGRESDRGEILARWRINRPLAVSLAFETESETTDGSSVEHRKGVSFGIPIELDVPYQRNVKLGRTSGTLGLELDPSDALNINVDFSRLFDRKIEIATNDNDEVRKTDRSEAGWNASTEASLSLGNLSLSGKLEKGSLNSPWTGRTPTDQERKEFSIRYKSKGSWEIFGKVANRRRSNNDPVAGESPGYEWKRTAVNLGGSLKAGSLNLNASCALLDTETGFVNVYGYGGYDQAVRNSIEFGDQSASLDASYDFGSCRAEFRAFYLDLSTDDDDWRGYSAFRVEPRFQVKLSEDAGLSFGLFRYKYWGKDAYTAQGLILGATFYPGHVSVK